MNLDSSLINRRKIIDSARVEFIGPSVVNKYTKLFNENISNLTAEESYNNYFYSLGGIKEEIIQQEYPTRRYAAGMLYPIDSTVGEVLINELAIQEDLKEIPNDNSMRFTESEDYSEEISILNEEKLPSSMGLTCNISKKTKQLNLVFTGGKYNYKDIEIYAKGKKRWWFRQSITAELDVIIDDLVKTRNSSYSLKFKNNLSELINDLNMECIIQSRDIGESILATITLINRSLSKNKKASIADELVFYQAEFTVQTDMQGEFLKYPKYYERNLPLSLEEATDELLYRNKVNYAFGHGCSTNWEPNTNVRQINTTFLPEYETTSMTPDIEYSLNGTLKQISITMSSIIQTKDYNSLKSLLLPLLDAYESWITQEKKRTTTLPDNLRQAATNNLGLCEEALSRMKKGVALLENEKVFKAFTLANKAMLLQQVNGKVTRNPIINNTQINFDKDFDDVVIKGNQIIELNNSWRAFQIAFFLMSIDGIVNPESSEREIVDLIWFPTGGGKTEAYFAVAAFQMLYRRLKDRNDTGVDVLMRYTLRLLTADQFQRSSRLICALEIVRRELIPELGDKQFSIGMWVGSATSPNSYKRAWEELNNINQKRNSNSFVVNKCPWCGCKIGKIGKGRDAVVLGYTATKTSFKTRCLDKNCDFHQEIPVYFIDEAIYEEAPTFLIGTIDKFVQLTWKPEARSLFGINKDGQQVANPPNLIIQDELHLISGPLGTLAGLYELVIEELCSKKIKGRTIKPKIISATATIKGFHSQAKSLFGRIEAKLFPSPGLDIDDSFFAKVAKDENGNNFPGRKYIGIYTTSVGLMQAQVKLYSSVLQEAKNIPLKERDPYWTMLSFYNSLRDLGSGINLCSMDVPSYMKSIANREGYKDIRYIKSPLELTSRMENQEIVETIDRLKIELNGRNDKNVLDICLASNIIEVGVDIDRLSLMTIVGQPKTTAQYIQVSGRVGRKWNERPGLIFTIYSNRNSRDKSHFEHFNEYHQRLYAQVETSSITPFSDSSLDRGAYAVIIAFIRQRFSQKIANEPSVEEYINSINTEEFKDFLKNFSKRVKLVDEEQYEAFKNKIISFNELMSKGLFNSWEATDSTPQGLMYRSGDPVANTIFPDAIPMINSLRNVDAASLGRITSEMIRNQPKQVISLEDLL